MAAAQTRVGDRTQRGPNTKPFGLWLERPLGPPALVCRPFLFNLVRIEQPPGEDLRHALSDGYFVGPIGVRLRFRCESFPLTP
jgi:hypothetical protein